MQFNLKQVTLFLFVFLPSQGWRTVGKTIDHSGGTDTTGHPSPILATFPSTFRGEHIGHRHAWGGRVGGPRKM